MIKNYTPGVLYEQGFLNRDLEVISMLVSDANIVNHFVFSYR